jgi:hypothetical protein|tara:strand:+ start:238 stop:705 length:468 start_codon:yes stop_codon:yes gene_type:complete
METKQCNKCNEIKSLSEFQFRKERNSYATSCKDCRRAWGREHYKKNKQYYVNKASIRNAKTIVENRKKLVLYLESHPCVDCGETNIMFLEFDHVTGEKKKAISDMILDKYCWETILEEINKCVVRCMKCHRIKTYKEIKWWGFQYVECPSPPFNY